MTYCLEISSRKLFFVSSVENVKAEIIEAAFKEFEQKGFGNSTLASIAERAGISRTTIYLYYKTKEAIFEAAIRGTVEQTIDEATHLAQGHEGDFRTVFASVLDLVYQRLVSGQASIILKVLVAEGQDMPDLIVFYRTKILSKGEQLIQGLIARGVSNGELSPDCLEYDVRILVAPAIFAGLWRNVFDKIDPLDIEAFKQMHIRLICDALLSRD